MLSFPRAEDAAIRFVDTVVEFKPLNDKALCEAMVQWNVSQDLLPPRTAAALLQRTDSDAEAVATVAGRTRDLGDAVRRLLNAAARSGTAGPADLRTLNAELGFAVGQGQLVRGPRRLDWGWTATTSPLERILWVPAVSATRLLTRGDFSRLRACAATSCERLFLDRTRNGLRRWCSMSRCGNREKAARFRDRHRTEPRGNHPS